MATDQSELEPIDPRTAQQLYLDHKRTECTESTVRNHKYHTNYLVDWCEENDVDNLNELTGRNLQEIRLWRKEVGDINLLTLNNHMSTLRVFLKWAASIEAVPENLYDKVMVPGSRPRMSRLTKRLMGTARERFWSICRRSSMPLSSTLYSRFSGKLGSALVPSGRWTSRTLLSTKSAWSWCIGLTRGRR